MRDIQLFKGKQNKCSRQHNVANYRKKGNSHITAKKHKSKHEKKKTRAENMAMEKSLLSKCEVREQIYKSIDYSKFLMEACKEGDDDLVFSILPHYDVIDYDRSTGISILGYALLNCEIHPLIWEKRDKTTDFDYLFPFFGRNNYKEEYLVEELFKILEKKKNKCLEEWNPFPGIHDIGYNMTNKLGNTLLHYACMFSRVESVKKLVSLKMCKQLKNSKGEEPIHVAAKVGNLEILQLLLVHGAKTNSVTAQQLTPLMIACLNDNKKTVTELIQHGADISLQTDLGDVLGFAVNKCKRDVLRALLEYGNPQQVIKSSYKGLPTLCSILMRMHNGMSDENKYVPYRLRIFSLDICNNGSSIDKDDNIVIWIKYCENHFNDWNILLSHDTKLIDCRNDNGNSLLHLACKYGRVRAVEMLIKFGICINSKNKDGNTPLHYACKVKSKNDACHIVKMLLDKGANIHIENNEGYCPIAMACQGQKKDAIEMMLRRNVTVRFKNIETDIFPKFLQYSCTWFPDVLPLFLKFGAQVKYPSPSSTPLDTIFTRFVEKSSRNQHRTFLIHFLITALEDERDQYLPSRSQLSSAIKTLVSAGVIATNMNTMIKFERILINDENTEFVTFLHQSCYKFHCTLEIPESIGNIVKEINTLQQLCTATIRRNVKPNVWYAVNFLPLPKRLKNAILLNVVDCDNIHPH